MVNMNAEVMVHWPGQSTAMCRKHADKAQTVARFMGMPVTETDCDPQECKNCTNSPNENPASAGKEQEA